MKKYTDIKIFYNSPCFPPDGLKMNKIYTIIKHENILYVKTGDEKIQLEESVIKMLFSPQDEKISWEDVDFNDEVKNEVKVVNKYK